ncbi:MAG: redox-regulated ATPase YchF [Bacillota bacterium]
MKLGVVGLPNVGKSTLFNAITKAGAESANYPFCTIEPNVGTVLVKDERLDNLRELYNSRRVVPTAIEFVDIAGLVKGASKGEGLGNKFLSHIREVDAIVHVVRAFEDENITHVDGKINPASDMETINMELAFADMETAQKRYDKALGMRKGGDKKYQIEADLLKRIIDTLEAGEYVRNMEFTAEEAEYVKHLFLLTSKPVIYCANIAEDDVATPEEDLPLVCVIKEVAQKEHAEVIVISAKIEEEIGSLEDEEDKAMFLDDLGLSESGLDKLVASCYSLLGLISYLTAGEQEVRAWTITKGTKAPGAAGKIHTDFERGFIKAEVVDYTSLIELGGYVKAREKGKVRIEGKEYVVQDGDVILFRFNV